MNNITTYCGFVVIIGEPNVGKSLLFNRLVGRNLSIVSQKSHTTQHSIIGVYTDKKYQIIYLDTPGFCIKENKKIHFQKKIINDSIYDAELIIFVVSGTFWTKNNETILKKITNVRCPIILAINKIDIISNRRILLPYINFLCTKKINFYEILPICTINGINIDKLQRIIRTVLPKSIHFFPKNYLTNKSKDFLFSEIIREKLMRFFGAEIPYSVTIKIERSIFDKITYSYKINALIFVKRQNHKKIIIGRYGNKIKIISIESRKDIEKLLNIKVHLKLWVKIQIAFS